MEKALCQRHPSTQTSGKRPDSILAPLLQSEPDHQVRHTLLQLWAPESIKTALVEKVFLAGQFQVQAIGLKNNPNQAADLMGISLHIHVHHSRFSLLRNEKRAKDAKQGRLASTIGSQQSEDLFSFNGESDVFKCLVLPVAETHIRYLNHSISL
jgi:hypothetical protein